MADVCILSLRSFSERCHRRTFRSFPRVGWNDVLKTLLHTPLLPNACANPGIARQSRLLLEPHSPQRRSCSMLGATLKRDAPCASRCTSRPVPTAFFSIPLWLAYAVLLLLCFVTRLASGAALRANHSSFFRLATHLPLMTAGYTEHSHTHYILAAVAENTLL